MKKALLFLLTISLLLPLGALSSTAYVVDIDGRFIITTQYTWDSEELKPMVEGLPAHKVETLEPTTVGENIFNRYRLTITDRTPAGSHDVVYYYLSQFDTISVEGEYIVCDENGSFYLMGAFYIETDYAWDSEELRDVVEALPVHTSTVATASQYSSTTYDYEGYVYLDDISKHESVYTYLKTVSNIKVSLTYLSFPDREDMPALSISFSKGDINGDMKIDSLDAAAILKYDAQLLNIPLSLTVADVNSDGKVNSLDAALILRYDAGMIEGF